MIPPRHSVYLIPGFFGFVNFGGVFYFGHVNTLLEERLDALGVPATIHQVRISPTASIRRRATELLEYIASTAPASGPIHLIGHSTGGLDARLLATPGVSLGARIESEAFAARLRTVVTVATPHFGTPLASFFTGLLGQRLLELLSLGTVYVLRTGRVPIGILARMAALLAKARLTGHRMETVLDLLWTELLEKFNEDQRLRFVQFFRDVRQDTALLPQLAPEGIELFNTMAEDRPGVRYGGVLTRARPPSLGGRWAAGRSPYVQATYVIFDAIYRLTARMPSERLPRPSPEQVAAMARAWPRPPVPSDNDGIVPTLSQVRGRIIHAATADHLDVLGHFEDRTQRPPHIDWLTTGSGFGRRAFVQLWSDVARFIAAA